MQISSNTTGMEAGLTVFTDKNGRDHCVVVVKGTFDTDANGMLRLSKEQRPMVYADEHYGESESTPVRYECEFVPTKPFGEVLVVGKAIAPKRKPVSELLVELDVAGSNKSLIVIGDRSWEVRCTSFRATAPKPFTEMPITFDRSFGGEDDSRGEGKIIVEHRNLLGVGFYPHRPRHAIEGAPLPNVEHPKQLISSPRDTPDPIGFGVQARSDKQRVTYAGTYDEKWLDDECPFLPADFDDRYFMSAPDDQWFPHFKGGEVIRCKHMAEEPVVEYRLPTLRIPVLFRFVDKEVETEAVFDTVIVEPHDGRAMLLFRVSVPLRKKLNQLQEVFVGERPKADEAGLIGYRNGKPHFRGLGAVIQWRKSRKGLS